MDELHPERLDGFDSQPAIQRDIDDAHRRGGGIVQLAHGPWLVGRSLELRANVTLRGSGMTATVLVPLDGLATVVRATGALTGATLEDLTVRGAPMVGDAAVPRRATADPAVDLGEGVSFCFLRRLRLVELAGPGIRIAGPVDHLYLEQVGVQGCGGDGIAIDAAGASEAVFLTEISVRSFGLGGDEGAAGIRLGGRAFVSQLHVQPIEVGMVGLALGPGSEHTVASNLFFGVRGGQARSVGRVAASIEAELVRDLDDLRLARVFP